MEKNAQNFGLIEGVKRFEEIYPKRQGAVSFVNERDPLKFTDTSMDFDLNDQLMGGVSAKLTFNSGELAGYELEIHAYNHVKKELELIAFDEGKGNKIPNERFKIQKGDTYVLHDIYMPQVYVQKAEEELREKALEYLEKYSKPNITYSLSSDYVYLRRKLISLDVGDLITIEDEDFELSLKTRVVSLSQSLLNPYDYQIKLSDEISVSYFTSLLEG